MNTVSKPNKSNDQSLGKLHALLVDKVVPRFQEKDRPIVREYLSMLRPIEKLLWWVLMIVIIPNLLMEEFIDLMRRQLKKHHVEDSMLTYRDAGLQDSVFQLMVDCKEALARHRLQYTGNTDPHHYTMNYFVKQIKIGFEELVLSGITMFFCIVEMMISLMRFYIGIFFNGVNGIIMLVLYTYIEKGRKKLYEVATLNRTHNLK